MSITYLYAISFQKGKNQVCLVENVTLVSTNVPGA